MTISKKKNAQIYIVGGFEKRPVPCPFWDENKQEKQLLAYFFEPKYSVVLNWNFHIYIYIYIYYIILIGKAKRKSNLVLNWISIVV